MEKKVFFVISLDGLVKQNKLNKFFTKVLTTVVQQGSFSSSFHASFSIRTTAYSSTVPVTCTQFKYRQ